MHIEIDQSGRFEATKDDTVIAFSNGTSFSVLIPAQVKRYCILTLREAGISGPTFYLQLFTACLFFLLKGHIKKNTQITIDIEYTGKDRQIKEYLINLFIRMGKTIDPDMIDFRRIGKKSNAHILALSTWRGEKKAGLVLTADILLRIFRPTKKSGIRRLAEKTQ